jgi:hypothetical protein
MSFAERTPSFGTTILVTVPNCPHSPATSSFNASMSSSLPIWARKPDKGHGNTNGTDGKTRYNQHTSSSTATLASSTNLVGGRSNRMLSANHSHTNGAAPMEMEGMACKQRHDTPEDQQHNDNRQRGSHLVRHLRSGTVRKLQHRHILQSREEKQHLEEQW